MPRPFTAAIMAMLMPAAMSPYSMAVAADSFVKKRNKMRIGHPSVLVVLNPRFFPVSSPNWGDYLSKILKVSKNILDDR